MKRIYRKGLLAAQLCIEMEAGLHVPQPKLTERGGGWTVVSVDRLIGPTGGGPAFTTIHFGAFRPLERSAR